MKDVFQEINLVAVFGYIKSRDISQKANDMIHDLKDQNSDLCGG